jgi:hypothetical protein
MKKTTHRHHRRETHRRGFHACHGGDRWAFNLASERLFSIGSPDGFRRVAYRTALGEIRFLPLRS